MALHKFEKQFKNAIQNRSITPSESSWDRLDAMLTVREEKKPLKTYYWTSIAASLFVLSTLGYFFYNQNTPVNEFQQQNTPSTVQKKEQNQVIKTISTPEINRLNDELSARISNVNEPVNKSSIIPKQKESETKNNSSQFVNIDPTLQIQENKLISKKETTGYTYITPEKLLAEVEGTKITSIPNKPFRPTVKVNANELLSSVENELNQTFKEKALQKFKEAKTAFANRNYE